jgi:hypothetical protein
MAKRKVNYGLAILTKLPMRNTLLRDSYASQINAFLRRVISLVRLAYKRRKGRPSATTLTRSWGLDYPHLFWRYTESGDAARCAMEVLTDYRTGLDLMARRLDRR